MNRLIFTVARGKPKYGEMAVGLGRSMRLCGETNRTAILTDLEGDWDRYFDVVVRPPGKRSALDKLLALELTDADQVVAIDCDCINFRRLDDVFDHCAGFDFAVQGDTQSSGTWHGADVAELCRKLGRPTVPRFNGGFLYYERQPSTLSLIDRMKELERDYATLDFAAFRGNASEEVCVALAMMETGIGTTIPDYLDFMSTAVGLVGPLRMDIRRGLCEYLCRRERVRYVRPYVFHASRYSNFVVYWKQLRYLEQIWRG